MTERKAISQRTAPEGRKALLPGRIASRTFHAPLFLPSPPALPTELHETARPQATLTRKLLLEEIDKLRQENATLIESLAQATRALESRDSRTVKVGARR